MTVLYTTGGHTRPVYTTGGHVAFGGGSPIGPDPSRTDPALLTSQPRHVITEAYRTPFAVSAHPEQGSTSVSSFTFTAPAYRLRVWLTGETSGASAALVIRGVAYPLTVNGEHVFDVPDTLHGSEGVLTDPLPDGVYAEMGDSGAIRRYSPPGSIVWTGKGNTDRSGIMVGNRILEPAAPSSPGKGAPPRAVIGHTLPDARSVLLDGDSIMTTDWARAACTVNGHGFFDYAQWGIQAGAFTFPRGPHGELSESPWEYFLWERGTNNTGQAQPAVYNTAISSLYVLADGGIRGAQTTLVPRTTSTDQWETTGSQTPASSPEWREEWNAWVRDGSPVSPDREWAPPGSTGALRAGDPGHMLAFPCFDLAAVVETGPAENRLWKPGRLTTDGTHLSAAGNQLIRDAAIAWVEQHFVD